MGFYKTVTCLVCMAWGSSEGCFLPILLSHAVVASRSVPVSPPGLPGGCRAVPNTADFLLHSPIQCFPPCNPKWPVWNEAELVCLRWDRCREDLRGMSVRADHPMCGLSLLLVAVSLNPSHATFFFNMESVFCNWDNTEIFNVQLHPQEHENAVRRTRSVMC